MKKDYKLIDSLNPLLNFHTFSKYSNSLDKMFKKKSLRNLLYSLNNPSKFNEDYIDERLNKKEIDIDIERSNTDKNDNNKNLLEYNYEDYLQSQRERFNKNKKTEPWSINLKTPRIPLVQRKLDFYKYNPNYNSIYKNIPSISFVKASKKKSIFSEKIKSESKKNNEKNNNNLFLKNKKPKNYSESRNDTKNNYCPLLTSVSYQSSNTINNESHKSISLYDKNNHTFRFSKYCPRKPLLYKVNNKVTYLNDLNYLKHLNKTIDFKTMPKRNDNYLVNTYTLENPSMCYYNPKYDCVEIKTKKISFNPEAFKKSIKYKKNKKLKRILMSYDTNKEYLTIDNSKLVKTESITKLLNL